MSSEPRGSSKAKNKARLSFKELLDNKGDSQEQKGRPNKAKDTKASFGRQELKVIVLLCHIHLMYRLLYGFGHILVIVRL